MKKISYAETGVDYSQLDSMKRLAQTKAAGTASMLNQSGMNELPASRGESAYVWDTGDSYAAFVVEGLGTKNLVADAMRKVTGKTYYDSIGKDAVAAIVNDIVVVGAKPLVVNAYWGVGDSSWHDDLDRARDLVDGWGDACIEAGATWGGGETPGLSGIIESTAIDIGGACVGVVNPKKRLTLGDKIQPGDKILLVESSGIHANGLSLARKIASELPDGYATKLPSGNLYGESLLRPSHLYAKLAQDWFGSGIDIHYMVHVTGHGWRKLMRAPGEFSYVMTQLPPVPEEFDLIQHHSGSDIKDMYSTFNMGAGFAVYLPESDVETALKLTKAAGFRVWDAGRVEAGPKQVIIEPLGVTFAGSTLEVR
jgi:phosphoribosylformylglycinamidine cyclo-ligase